MARQMAELLYADRARHFNEERRLCAEYLQSVSPDAATVHAAAVQARSLVETRRLAEREAASLVEREGRLSARFDEVTELVYKAKATEDERTEKLEFLSTLPALAEVDRDTTYYFRDLSKPKRSSSSKELSQATQTKAVVTSKRIQTGRETKLERDLLQAIQQTNETKTAIGRLLDGIEHRALDFTSDFSKSVSRLREEAKQLVAEAERLDQVSLGTVLELLSLRLRVMVLQREETEDSERLEREARYFADKETEIHMQLNNEVTELNQKFEKEIQERLRDYQQQLSSLSAQETRLLQRAQVMGDPDKSSSEVSALLQQEKEAKARYDKLRLRNRLEMEGFNNESLALRRRLAALEKNLRKRK